MGDGTRGVGEVEGWLDQLTASSPAGEEVVVQVGQQVHGSDGSLIGVVGGVYVEAGGRVRWLEAGGMLVPADEACLFEGVVHVPYGVPTVRTSPRVAHAREISEVDVLVLNRHYGISARADAARPLH